MNNSNFLFELFKKSVEKIENIGIADSEAEVKFFFREKFNLSISEIILGKSSNFSMEEIEKEVKKYILRREKREPVQYIIGHTWFYGSKIYTDPKVLIPRNETELLVEETINIIQNKKVDILEIGVGSGCIGKILLDKLENITYVGTDINRNAISLAKKNIGKNNRCKLLFDDIYSGEELFDIILSNPPYIEEEEYLKLEPELKYEPENSLVGGKTGLDIIKKIFEVAETNLKRGGYLLFEIGYNQGEKLRKIAELYSMSVIKIIKDYADFDRIVVIKRND